MNKQLLKDLCDICAPSGNEEKVVSYIEKLLKKENISYTADALGNLYVSVAGSHPEQKVMVSAHTDEVGLIATDIDGSGYIRFAPVGGIDSRIFIGKRVISERGTVGIIGGVKPYHLQTADERGTAENRERLFIDIGAVSKEDAETKVLPGEYFSFVPNYESFGDGMTVSKALDDRAGCSVMLELIKEKFVPYYDTVFVFTTMEEVGTRGAAAAAYNAKPDFAVVLETTTAGDIEGAPEHKKMCRLREGAVVSFMDNGTVYDREFYSVIFEIAKEKEIDIQSKNGVAGGNDSAVIHRSRGGVRTAAVSIPTRYLHSPSCVIANCDYDSTLKLVKAILTEPLTGRKR